MTLICKNLNYDKTINLGGYPIKMGAYLDDQLLSYDKRKSGLQRFGGVNGEIQVTIWSHLNATASANFYTKPGFVDDQGSLRGYLCDLLSNKIEIAMNMNALRDFWRLQSYPQETAGYCIVSHKDSQPSIQHFKGIFNVRGWLLLGLAGLLILAIIKRLLRRSFAFAALELLRMIITMPVLSNPANCLVRGLLVYFTLATMLVNTYFQSRLTAFDVVPISKPTVDTIEDMIRSNLMIYGTLSYHEFLQDLNIKHRYEFGTYVDCVERLRSGSSILCIASCYEARLHVYDNTLHVSKEFRRFHMAFSTEEDWPLYSRFNQLLHRMNSAGLMGLFKRRGADKFLRNLEPVNNDYRTVFRRNMKMNFYLILAGTALACLVFCTEHCYDRTKRKFYARLAAACAHE